MDFCVVQSLVLFVVFCRTLFVLSLFALYCLSFFDLWLLFTPLVIVQTFLAIEVRKLETKLVMVIYVPNNWQSQKGLPILFLKVKFSYISWV